MVYRNVSIIIENSNKVDALEACEQICHECPLKGEVENYKEDIVVEKKDSILKIILENKELMKKKYQNQQNVFHTIKVNNGMAIQVNNELKKKVDDQQVDTKHLKEKFEIDDEDKVQKTTDVRT